MTYIPLDQCKHGGLYRIHSRNLRLGVFNERDRGFIGIREKFGNLYLFTEYHWDTGEPFGTVHPLEFLEDYPGEVSETVEKVQTEEDSKRWISTSSKVGDLIRVDNEELFAWLTEKEKQYLENEGSK